MGKKLIILVILIILGVSLFSLAAAQTAIVQPKDEYGQIFPNGQYTFQWNWTTSSDCTGVVGSFLAENLKTNIYGIGSADMDLTAGLSSIPQYVCEYRGGNLRKASELQDIATRDIYARNINASNFNGIFNWTTSSPYLNFDGSTLDFNDTSFNNTYDNRYLNLSGGNADQNIDIGSFNFTTDWLKATNINITRDSNFNGTLTIQINKSIRSLPINGGSSLFLQSIDTLGAGGFPFIRQALDSDGNRIITHADQNGRNNSFSFQMNSFGAVSKSWIINTSSGHSLENITFLFNTTDYPQYCSWLQTNLSIVPEGCQYFADTIGRGVPLLFAGDLEVHRSATIHEGLLVFHDFNYATRQGFDANFFNTSIHIQRPVNFNQGFIIGDEVLIQISELDATIDPMQNIQADAGNWHIIDNGALCSTGRCATSNGISGTGNVIMQTNFSTADVDNLKLSFVYSIVGLVGSDDFEITANNNVGSGDVSLLSDTGDEVLNSQIINLPASMEDKAQVTINFVCDATKLTRGCFVDTYKVNGTASANTSINIDGFDSEICGSDGSRDANGNCNRGIRYDAETDEWIVSGTLNASLVSTSGVSGSGTTNTIPLWSASTSLTNSIITQDGTTIVIAGAINSTDWSNVSITESQISDFGDYLKNDTSARFTDLNITGILTAGDLIWNGNLNLGGNNITSVDFGFFNRIGINNTINPTHPLDVRAIGEGAARFETDNGGELVSFYRDNVERGQILLNSNDFNLDAITNALVFMVATDEKMRIHDDGNVGIGTSSPLGDLHIKSPSSNNAELYLEATDFTPVMSLYSAGANIQPVIKFGTGSGSSKLQIQTITAGGGVDGAGTAVMTLQEDGNVGIGTSSPTTKLQVTKLNAESVIAIHRDGSDPSTDTDIGKLSFQQDFSSSPQEYGLIKLGTNDIGGTRSSMSFEVKSTAGALIEGLNIRGTSAGVNVGIGTSSPSQALHVEGQGNFTGNITMAQDQCIKRDGGGSLCFK